MPLRSSKHQIPDSVVQARRDEIDDRSLDVEVWALEHGKLAQVHPSLQNTDKLPIALQGSCFFAAALPPRSIVPPHDLPQNHPKCQQTATAKGNLIINGDGMIYRLTFQQGKAQLKTRIAKTPCYYADLVTEKTPKVYSSKTYAFRNNGPSRMSLSLGSRNQLNTAFLQTPDHRLLVTFDAGRPWEIDPESMELLSPVGVKQEWLSLFPSLAKSVFPVLSSPAHPVCDFPAHLGSEDSDEIFTLNYSIGYKGKFQKQFDRLLGWNRTYCVFKKRLDQETEKTWGKRFVGFTDLIHYDFNDPQPKIQRWQLVLEGKRQQPLIGKQSLHQVAITKNYIIFGDTAFKIEFSQLFFSFVFGLPEQILNAVGKTIQRLIQEVLIRVSQSGSDMLNQRSLGFLKHLETARLHVGYWLYQVFRKLLPPDQYTHFYIIDRRQIHAHSGRTLTEEMTSLPVKQVTIPREVSHFAVDYCDRDQQIILHVGHNNGWDVTEWVSQYDRSVKGKKHLFDSNRLGGMIVGTTDLGSLGRYTVDANTGKLMDAKIIQNDRLTWGVSVYTHRELDHAHQTIDQLYWLCTGFSWELLPDRIFEIYKQSPLRVIPPTQLPDTKPVTLLRLDTQQMKIVDWFEFPAGYYAGSPQFIPSSEPCPPGKDPAIHGYIACIVLSDAPQGDEFWIFDASNLGNRQDWGGEPIAQPFVYRLSCPEKLNIGFSIHSTWCSEDVRNMASIRYGDRQRRQDIRTAAFQNDYSGLQHQDQKIDQLLEKVKTYFIEQTSESKKIDQLLKKVKTYFIEQTSESSF